MPIDRVERLEPAAARTSTTKLDLAQFERRPGRGAAALRRARPQPDQRRHRAAGDRARGRAGVRGRDAGAWPGSTRASARGCGGLLPRRFRGHDSEHRQFVAWDEIEPFVGHVPSSRLKLATRRLRAPASGPDRRSGRGGLARGGRGDPRGGRRRTRSSRPTCSRSSTTSTRSSSCASAPIRRSPRCWRGWRATTPPTCCSRSTRSAGSRSSTCCRRPSSARSRRCSGYNPSTAGGLMNPDFVSVPRGRDCRRRARARPGAASSDRPAGVDRVRGRRRRARWSAWCRWPSWSAPAGREPSPACSSATLTPTVPPEADLPEVARLMSDFNLIAMPVVDRDGRPGRDHRRRRRARAADPRGVAPARRRGARLVPSDRPPRVPLESQPGLQCDAARPDEPRRYQDRRATAK